MTNMDQLNKKVARHYGDVVINKRLATQAGLERMPRHVSEYLLAAGTKSGTSLRISEVQRRISDYFYEPDQNELLKSRLMTAGSLKLIGHLTVTANLGTGQYTGSFTQLPRLRFMVGAELVDNFPEVLVGGVWGNAKLVYDRDKFDAPQYLGLASFSPYQLTGVEDKIQQFCEARERFSLAEWVDFLLISIGYSPGVFNKPGEGAWAAFPPGTREKILMLCRLIPLVQSNCHMVELGPRNTGKSFLLQSLSPRVSLLSGAKATVPMLLSHGVTKRVGLLGLKQVVIFDEISGNDDAFADASLRDSLKDYMASGSFARDQHRIAAGASLFFCGNVGIGPTGTPSPHYRHVFQVFPENLRDDPAFFDRIHGFIPGWQLPKLRSESYSDQLGLIADFLGETLSSLRRETAFLSYTNSRVQYTNATTRDQQAISKTMAGLLKLLCPDGAFREDAGQAASLMAVELRQGVHNALAAMMPGEFPQKQLGAQIRGRGKNIK